MKFLLVDARSFYGVFVIFVVFCIQPRYNFMTIWCVVFCLEVDECGLLSFSVRVFLFAFYIPLMGALIK